MSKDEKFEKLCELEVCHASLRYADRNSYDILITSYPITHAKNRELELEFFDFLKNVMYRQWADVIHLEWTEDGLPYIRVEPLSDIPASVLYNFCIASRVPVERPDEVKRWAELCKLGLHPMLAFALCRCGVKTDHASPLDQKVSYVMMNIEHWPFYNTASLELLLSGPKYKSLDYKAWPSGCTPTNVIWGEQASLKSLEGKTIREFCSQWKKDHPDNEDILLAS